MLSKVAISLSLSLGLLGAASAQAAFQPFDRTVTCLSANDGAALKVVYDKSEYPDFGWQGGIHVDLTSGNDSALIGLVEKAGLATDGSKKTIHIDGPAGQVGNWIQQDTTDPLIAHVSLSFTAFFLDTHQANTFIFDLSLSQATVTGLDNGDKLSTTKIYILHVLDDYGERWIPFDPSECKISS
jgi:hypothetical protein